MKVRRRRDGAITFILGLEEGLLLRELPQRLRALLESRDFTNRLAQRLFPRAYEDPSLEREYHRLLGDDLRRRKLDGIAAFERTLADSKLKQRSIEVTVARQDFDLWLGFVNDMRLVLGTELGIHDNDWSRGFDPRHPQAEEMILLHFLSWIEQSVLTCFGFDGPDPKDV